MAEDLGYGKRLSGEEYDRMVVELYREAPALPSKQQDIEIRKRELDLSIDYRLGLEFPVDRREALWAIMQRVEKKRLWLLLKYGLRSLWSRKRIPEHLPQQADALAVYLVDEFARVLSEQELKSFFALEPGEKPSLPISGAVGEGNQETRK